MKCALCAVEATYYQPQAASVIRTYLCKTHAEAIEEHAPVGSIRALNSESVKVPT